MCTVSDVLVYVSPIIVAVSGLLYRWLKYRLIWRVYKQGGREDAVAIGGSSTLGGHRRVTR